MRILPALALSAAFLLPAGFAAAQTPQQAQQQAPAKPATKPATKPRTQTRRSAASLTLTVRVTDSTGAPLEGVSVSASGPVPREGTTDAAGSVRFLSMRPGNYRLRFSAPSVITLERDITIRAGQAPEPVEATLSPAPAPLPPPEPEPAEAPAPKAAAVTPPQPRTVAIPEFVERNPIGSREPSKRSVLACGGTSTTALLQIRDPLKDRVHENADELLYVVGGDGLLSLPTSDVPLQAGTLSLVPRGMTHSIQRRGRAALILLSTLTDTPCDSM
ncbi:MAG TPA: carboxypeptidase regulatory-like domain-containing protein [Vicinamibacterales bacterium]